MIHRVFCYGTLKLGYGNHERYIASDPANVFVGEAVSDDNDYCITGNYVPMLYKHQGVKHKVKGELFDVTDVTLARIDQLEGHPHGYRRETQKFHYEVEGQQLETYAWVYLSPRPLSSHYTIRNADEQGIVSWERQTYAATNWSQMMRWQRDHFDDAREYDVEGIQMRFQCTPELARKLYDHIRCKQQDPPTARFETYINSVPDAELGALLKEYVAESNHGGWEGYSSRDLTGIRRLMTDVMIYHQASKPEQTNDEPNADIIHNPTPDGHPEDNGSDRAESATAGDPTT